MIRIMVSTRSMSGTGHGLSHVSGENIETLSGCSPSCGSGFKNVSKTGSRRSGAASRERERGERERHTTGYEPFALDAPIQSTCPKSRRKEEGGGVDVFHVPHAG